jgi:serine/threonine protein kinase
MASCVGTTVYCAPELQTAGGLQTQTESSQSQLLYKGYGRSVDIWSMGCVVLEMLTGKKPYHYLEHEYQIIFQLGSGIPPKLDAPEIQKSELARSFLSECFKVNPEERPSAQTLLQHPFSNIITSIEQDSQDMNI